MKDNRNSNHLLPYQEVDTEGFQHEMTMVALMVKGKLFQNKSKENIKQEKLVKDFSKIITTEALDFPNENIYVVISEIKPKIPDKEELRVDFINVTKDDIKPVDKGITSVSVNEIDPIVVEKIAPKDKTTAKIVVDLQKVSKSETKKFTDYQVVLQNPQRLLFTNNTIEIKKLEKPIVKVDQITVENTRIKPEYSSAEKVIVDSPKLSKAGAKQFTDYQVVLHNPQPLLFTNNTIEIKQPKNPTVKVNQITVENTKIKPEYRSAEKVIVDLPKVSKAETKQFSDHQVVLQNPQPLLFTNNTIEIKQLEKPTVRVDRVIVENARIKPKDTKTAQLGDPKNTVVTLYKYASNNNVKANIKVDITDVKGPEKKHFDSIHKAEVNVLEDIKVEYTQIAPADKVKTKIANLNSLSIELTMLESIRDIVTHMSVGEFFVEKSDKKFDEIRNKLMLNFHWPFEHIDNIKPKDISKAVIDVGDFKAEKFNINPLDKKVLIDNTKGVLIQIRRINTAAPKKADVSVNEIKVTKKYIYPYDIAKSYKLNLSQTTVELRTFSYKETMAISIFPKYLFAKIYCFKPAVIAKSAIAESISELKEKIVVIDYSKYERPLREDALKMLSNSNYYGNTTQNSHVPKLPNILEKWIYMQSQINKNP